MTPKPAIKMPSLEAPPLRRGDDDTLLALRWNEHGQGPRIPPRGWAMRHAHRRFGSPEERSPRAEILAIPLPSAAKVPSSLGGRQK